VAKELKAHVWGDESRFAGARVQGWGRCGGGGSEIVTAVEGLDAHRRHDTACNDTDL
jgi:hypothetical protein